jgi:hypothetical protein
VHLRRALLLFAIVLGLVALAATLSRPDEGTERGQEPAGVSSPADTTSATEPTDVVFDSARPRARALEAGVAAEVLVEVDLPGQVEIPDLGLAAPADEFTPARFDVLEHRPGRYPILFTAAGDEEEDPAKAGTLVIEAAPEA